MAALVQGRRPASHAMTVAELLARLDGVKGRSPSWTARCPAHDDRHASLSITATADRILLHCHTGCPTETVARAMGLTMADLFLQSSSGKAELDKPAVIYDYTDEHGTSLFQVVRLFPKAFRQRRPDGAGGWIWNVNGTRRVLYRLPELLEAIGRGKQVFITEGEKDCDAVRQTGSAATTNPRGAGKWRKEYTAVFHGADVVVVADDDRPGHQHARTVGAALASVARSVVLRRPAVGKDVADHLAAGRTLGELLPLEEAQEDVAPTPDRAERRDRSKPRLAILVRDELVPVTDEALEALRANGDGLYVRGRLLVQVARAEADEEQPWLKPPEGGWVIVPLEVAALQDRLDRAARWMRLQRGIPVPARPPEWVAKQVMARLAWPFPWLAGVTEVPTLRPDGTVLDMPGYDASTGLLYSPNAEYGTVPELSRAEIPTQVDTLLDPVRDFPFVCDSDRAAYVGSILSLVGRHAIHGPVPGFPVMAPVPGTGKGLLTRLVAIIGTGREPAMMTMPGDDNEFRKRLLVLAITGTSAVLLDNLSGSVGSDQLAAALTATEFTDRLLGVSRLVTAPLTAVWFLTGNNLRFSRTLGRRMVPITLDPACEHPEDRNDFAYADLICHVRANRPALVRAALALLQAFILNGKPAHGQPKMGSFEVWDDLVRGAVVWAGLDDPAAVKNETGGRGRIRAEADADLEQLDVLLDALTAAFGDHEFQVADVSAKMGSDAVLMEALRAAASDRNGAITANSTGNLFRDVRDRWVRGRKLAKTPKAPGRPRGAWKVARKT